MFTMSFSINVKFSWSSATSSKAGDIVERGIQAGAIANDGPIDAALGTTQDVEDTLLANNGADYQESPATASLTIGGTPALGKMVHFKIRRELNGNDDMVEDAWLFGAWIQFGLLDAAVSEW